MARASYLSSDAAEAAFYSAMRRGDLESMMDVWAADPDIACVHPMGPRLLGTEQIRESWRQIFGAGALSFELRGAIVRCSGDLALHLVHECFDSSGGAGQRVILATNVYKRDGGGWRMILHHASPAPAPRPDASAPRMH